MPAKRNPENETLFAEGKWRCKDCKTIKPLYEFPVVRRRYTGHGIYCKTCMGIRAKGNGREARTGWTQTEFTKANEEQGGLCFICKNPDPAGSELHADHCHKTGTKRKLLCRSCNAGLGFFKDNPALLRAAAAYLELL